MLSPIAKLHSLRTQLRQWGAQSMSIDVEKSEPLARLTIKIDNSRPVELSDLTASLNAVAAQFQRFAARSEGPEDAAAKLFIHEIKSGSIIAELVSYLVNNHEQISKVAKTGSTVITFGKDIIQTIQDLRDGKKLRDGVVAKDLTDLKRMLETTAKDGGGHINLTATEGSTINVSITLNSLEANAIQNRAQKEIEIRREADIEKLQRVVFQWETASVSTTQKSSGRGIIRSVTAKAKPVFIDDAATKAQMVAGRSNPFLIGFVVDVELLTVDGKLMGYRIIRLHETLEDDPDDAD
jgi:hypothetical protein